MDELKRKHHFGYYERHYIKRGRTDASACACFANVHRELGDETNNIEYYEEALKLYNQALGLEKKVHYYKEAIELLKLIGNPELSVVTDLNALPIESDIDKFVVEELLQLQRISKLN